MTAVRSFLRNRIAMLLIIVSMIMGFVVPSVYADYSGDLSGLNHNAHEIHILDIRGMRDCVLEVSASERITAPVLVKSGGRAAQAFFSAAASVTLPVTALSARRAFGGISFITALPGVRTISSFLITTTHLKDGNK